MISYLELYKLLLSPWSGTKQIAQIAGCGYQEAATIRNKIEYDIKKQGKVCPKLRTVIVPTRYVIELLDLDMEYIKEMAKEEIALFGKDGVNDACISR